GGGQSGEGRCAGLIPEELRERLQSVFTRNGRFGAAIRLVGQIEVLELGLLQNGFDFCFELRSELALLGDGGEHGFAAVFELAEVLELLLNIPDLNFVKIAGYFFAIPRNERHGRAAVEEFDYGSHPLEGNVQQLGDVEEYGGGKSLEFSHDPGESPSWHMALPLAAKPTLEFAKQLWISQLQAVLVSGDTQQHGCGHTPETAGDNQSANPALR